MLAALAHVWHADVLTHERRGADVAVFTCRPRRPLPFRAGQHVTIECAYQPWQSRSYAIANAPRRDGILEFHVRTSAGSRLGQDSGAPNRSGSPSVSCALVDRLKPGDVLSLGAPAGSMALDPYSRRDVVFVTGGTGLARAKALIDELSRVNRTRWIHLFRGERRRDGFYDRENVDRLVERHPWLTVIRATSDEPDEQGTQATIPEVVTHHGPWPDHDFYVCGSSPMVAATIRQLDRLQVPMARIHRAPE
nr:FAD-binding oxidoreductase [uncultured Actinoplanes sp.]